MKATLREVSLKLRCVSHTRATRSEDIVTATSTVSEDPGTSADLDSDPATNWESAENKVQELAQQVSESTTRMDLLWDDMPVSTQYAE